jgi:hypothetical protein
LSARRWRPIVGLALVTAVAACAPAEPPATAVAIPDAPRRPDGVVVEPRPALPPPQEHAAARGVVALKEPLGGEAVVDVVRALIRAFEREDVDAMAALVTDDAVLLGPPRTTRGTLLDQWRARVKALDYGRLAGAEVARIDAIERWSFADLDAPGAPDRPAEMRPGDVLVRVPITTPRAGSEQLFGDVVIVLLRREGRAFKIAGFGEENGP